MENKLQHRSMIAFVGSYAEPTTNGLYACTFDPESGELNIVQEISGLHNPTFMDIDDQHAKLYVIARNEQGEGKAVAFEIDPHPPVTLRKINEQKTVAASTCHITFDPVHKVVISSSYGGGMIGVNPILANGSIGETTDVLQHEGSSIHPHQDGPHPHSATIDRNHRYAIVCDLGIDRIYTYQIIPESGKLERVSEVALTPGAGPRHFAFHPTYQYAYAINELNNTVTVFSYNEETGQLTEIESVSTLPDDFQGTSYCADIHLSPDGRFLYGSNRGHDSIVVFSIDPSTGKLSLVEHTSTRGEHPRNFALTPDARYLLVANRDTNNIVTFQRDDVTGKLEFHGQILEVPMPVCIKFMTI